jgi:hypothetical protein
LAVADPPLTRYRLRFLLQEIDLPQGDTLIGRSAACHVSIEDPLVSRQHARLTIEGEHATIEDLGSRNGLLVAGRPIQGKQELSDGDRIRIGTQELVFCRVSAPTQRGAGPNTRQTGFMTHCSDCSLPYPAELMACPSCGSTARVEDDTLSGVGESQRNWTLQLLVEVLAKAQSLGRWDDVERVLVRARSNIDESLGLDRPLERELVEHLSLAAMSLAAHRRSTEWAAWTLDLHERLAWVPGSKVLAPLFELEASQRAELSPAAARLIAAVRRRAGPSADEVSDFERLEALGSSGATE